jgi:DNA-binding winged helix-turn-helix (wHTH) protein
MGNSASASVTSSSIQGNDKELVTIAEKVHLTKDQYEVLNIICNTYQEFKS